MVLYTVVIRYAKSREEVGAVVESHRAYLDGFIENGMLLASGPLETGDGGILWVRANSRESLMEMIEGDPYSLSGVAEFSVLGFDVKKLASGMVSTLSV